MHPATVCASQRPTKRIPAANDHPANSRRWDCLPKGYKPLQCNLNRLRQTRYSRRFTDAAYPMGNPANIGVVSPRRD
jgi:hypothetical protein